MQVSLATSMYAHNTVDVLIPAKSLQAIHFIYAVGMSCEGDLTYYRIYKYFMLKLGSHYPISC